MIPPDVAPLLIIRPFIIPPAIALTRTQDNISYVPSAFLNIPRLTQKLPNDNVIV